MMKREAFPIAKIYVPAKRRATLDVAKAREIAESILKDGQQTPIMVRRDGDRFVEAYERWPLTEAAETWRLRSHGVVLITGGLGGIALALQILCGVDATLCADRVRPLDRDDGEEVDVTSHLGNLDGGRQTRQPATHDDDLRMSHKNFDFYERDGRSRRNYRTCVVSKWVALGAGSGGALMNARIVTRPMAISTTASPKHTYPKRCRALSPTVMPHFAQNNQTP